MAVRLATMNSVHPTPPSSATNLSPRPLGLRPPLPDRSVTADSIEDAYVTFILYCNPAVPLETDATALREAFRVPPKSDGKLFSTFTLFQLIKQLDSKELKTWAELALKLGVTPPDQEKGQSSQKIQQYAVRLKVSDACKPPRLAPPPLPHHSSTKQTCPAMDALDACRCLL
jgi:hypothetical protein